MPPLGPIPYSVTAPPIGRERERARLKALLENGRSVLVVGPPGVGKSTLAGWVASDYPRSVRVDLESAAETVSLESLLARAAGLEVGGDIDLPSLFQRLSRARPRAVVLDGAEAALDLIARCVAPLSGRRTSGRLIVTSCVRPSGWQGAELELGPLSPPEAARLFADRARDHGFDRLEPTHLGALVKALDGLPLAVELAASRLRYRTLEELVVVAREQPLEGLFRGG